MTCVTWTLNTYKINKINVCDRKTNIIMYDIGDRKTNIIMYDVTGRLT